jgi:hypothetical protein
VILDVHAKLRSYPAADRLAKERHRAKTRRFARERSRASTATTNATISALRHGRAIFVLRALIAVKSGDSRREVVRLAAGVAIAASVASRMFNMGAKERRQYNPSILTTWVERSRTIFPLRGFLPLRIPFVRAPFFDGVGRRQLSKKKETP